MNDYPILLHGAFFRRRTKEMMRIEHQCIDDKKHASLNPRSDENLVAKATCVSQDAGETHPLKKTTTEIGNGNMQSASSLQKAIEATALEKKVFTSANLALLVIIALTQTSSW